MKLFEVILVYPKHRSAFIPTAKQVTVNILNELQTFENTYVFQEHKKNEDHPIQLGVEIDGASKVILTGHFMLYFTRSKDSNKLWYLKPPSNEETIFYGCGKFAIEAYNAQGRLLARKIIIALPLTVSLEQYDSLRTEIKEIVTMFEVNPRYFIGRKDENKHAHSSQLKSLLNEFMSELNHLATHSDYLGFERSHDCLTLYHMTHQIQQFLTHDYKIMSLQHQRLQDEFQLRKSIANLPRSGADRGITDAMNKKESVLKEVLNDLEIELDILHSTLTSLTFLQSMNTRLHASMNELKDSDLSLDNFQYSKLNTLYKKIMKLRPRVSLETETLIDVMLQSPRIFEIWTYLKLYVECMRLQFVPRAPIIERLLSHMEKYKSLNSMVMHFDHRQTKDRLIVVFSPRIALGDGRNRQPSIVVSFVNSRKGSYNHHALEISHLPYQNTHFNYLLRNDLSNLRKRYIQELSGTSFKMTSISLVHSSSITNWDVQLEDDSPYTLAHYHVTPDQTSHLTTYITRLVHQYLGNTSYCPSCGSIREGIPYPSAKRPYKWTYVCDCHEIWTSHLCKNAHLENYHMADETENVWLLKYADANYNPLSTGNWDIHCPICDRDQSGDVFIQNINGERIELRFEN